MKDLFFEKRCRYSIRKYRVELVHLSDWFSSICESSPCEQVLPLETATNTGAQATSASETTSQTLQPSKNNKKKQTKWLSSQFQKTLSNMICSMKRRAKAGSDR